MSILTAFFYTEFTGESGFFIQTEKTQYTIPAKFIKDKDNPIPAYKVELKDIEEMVANIKYELENNNE